MIVDLYKTMITLCSILTGETAEEARLTLLSCPIKDAARDFSCRQIVANAIKIRFTKFSIVRIYKTKQMACFKSENFVAHTSCDVTHSLRRVSSDY